jgi:homoserine kinase
MRKEQVMFQPSRISVRVPASTSNLGPGFDALGLALDLATTVTVDVARTTAITVAGEGCAHIVCDHTNLVYRRMTQMAERHERELPPVRMHIHNGIPLERGLGSSGAASLAGLLAADALLQLNLDQGQLLDLAYQLEGHPDNVTPSLLGGCTVSAIDNGHVTALHIPLADDLVCALCVPALCMPTEAARKIVPHTVARSDAVFNLSRTALLATALATGRYDALQIAVQDRLHQPYRAEVFPPLFSIIDAAYDAGAYGAFLSGAGSTVAALVDPAHAQQVADAMAAAGEQHGLACRTHVARIDRDGATVKRDA